MASQVYSVAFHVPPVPAIQLVLIQTRADSAKCLGWHSEIARAMIQSDYFEKTLDDSDMYLWARTNVVGHHLRLRLHEVLVEGLVSYLEVSMTMVDSEAQQGPDLVAALFRLS